MTSRHEICAGRRPLPYGTVPYRHLKVRRYRTVLYRTVLYLPLQWDPTSKPLRDVVTGFKVCLGVTRHPSNNDSFIAEALLPVAGRHDNLLDLVFAACDEDPFVAL